jgi:hypothetical protein
MGEPNTQFLPWYFETTESGSRPVRAYAEPDTDNPGRGKRISSAYAQEHWQSGDVELALMQWGGYRLILSGLFGHVDGGVRLHQVAAVVLHLFGKGGRGCFENFVRG